MTAPHPKLLEAAEAALDLCSVEYEYQYAFVKGNTDQLALAIDAVLGWSELREAAQARLHHGHVSDEDVRWITEEWCAQAMGRDDFGVPVCQIKCDDYERARWIVDTLLAERRANAERDAKASEGLPEVLREALRPCGHIEDPTSSMSAEVLAILASCVHCQRAREIEAQQRTIEALRAELVATRCLVVREQEQHAEERRALAKVVAAFKNDADVRVTLTAAVALEEAEALLAERADGE